MKIVHDPTHQQINFLDERFYTTDNKTYYPSVTTVLDVYPKGQGFHNWLKSFGIQSEEIVKKAAQQGTNVHNAIDRYINGERLAWSDNEQSNYTLEEWLMILKFEEFWNITTPRVLANEISLVSEELEMGGTIDLVCAIKNPLGKEELWLIDHKTSNSIHTTHELQLAAYATMWNLLNPKYPINRTGILHLKAATRGFDSRGEKIQGKGWQLKEFDRHYSESYKVFQHVHAIWKEEHPTYKPKNKIYPDSIQRKEGIGE